jgi:hypothetical protein
MDRELGPRGSAPAPPPHPRQCSAPLRRSRWEAARCLWSPQFTTAAQQRGPRLEVPACGLGWGRWRRVLWGGSGLPSTSPASRSRSAAASAAVGTDAGQGLGTVPASRASWTAPSARHPGSPPYRTAPPRRTHRRLIRLPGLQLRVMNGGEGPRPGRRARSRTRSSTRAPVARPITTPASYLDAQTLVNARV